MVNKTVIEAEPRTETGKNVARRLRQSGHMPGVLYGAGQPTVPVSLNPRQVRTVLESETGRNTILTVEVKGGETSKAMLVDWQYEPVHSRLLHVDLKRIVLDQQLQATVPVVRLGRLRASSCRAAFWSSWRARWKSSASPPTSRIVSMLTSAS